MSLRISARQLLRNFFSRFITDRLLFLITIATFVFLITDCFYVLHLLPWFTPIPMGDEPHYLVISQTMLKYHSLDVMRDYIHGDYHIFYPPMIDAHIIHNVRGEVLPLHNIGGPILWLIPFALLGRLGVVFFISAIAILCVVNIYKLVLLAGSSERIAFRVSLAYVLASPLYIYSHLSFIELIGAFICIHVLRKLLQVEITTSELWLCSLLIGLLPWVHIRFAQLEVSLFCLLLYRLYHQSKLRNIKENLALLLPVGILFVGLEVYALVVWGTWNPAANETINNTRPFEVLPFTNFFLGLFFDQEYGLLFSAPIFLFLLIGIGFSMRKKLLSYNLGILIVAIPYIIIFTSFSVWFGGFNPSARYLLVLLPLLCVYLAKGLERLQNPVAKGWFYFSIGYGFIYNLFTLSKSFSAAYGFSITLKLMGSLIHVPVTSYLPSLYACIKAPYPYCDQHEAILFACWITFFILVAFTMIMLSIKKSVTTVLKDERERT